MQVLGIFPFSSLLYLNFRITRAAKQNIQTACEPTDFTRRRSMSENKMTKTLILIVMTFLICHLPRVIMNSIEFYVFQELNNPPNCLVVIKSISQVLLVLNSSVNVLIYLCVNKSLTNITSNKSAARTTLRQRTTTSLYSLKEFK